MLKLHRLKIERFRDVTPCELVFGDGFNVLLGKNGSGKTTLLRLIADLYATPLGEIAPGEEFELEVEFRFESGFALTHVKRVLTQTPQDRLLLPTGAENRRYDFEVDVQCSLGQDKLQSHHIGGSILFQIIHNGEKREILTAPLEYSSVLNLVRLFSVTSDSVRTSLGRELTNIRMPFRFDESLEALELIRIQQTKFTITESKKDSNETLFYFDSFENNRHKEYYKRFSDTMKKTPNAERVVLDDSELDFLERFLTLTGLRSARMVSDRLEKKTVRTDSKVDSQMIFGNVHFSFTRRDGSEFPQEHLSYGQKRLLVFLYCQSVFQQVMIADELVNGLHHDWIETCLELIRDRQAFLSSQNPLLLDYLWFESKEEVQKTFILCKNEPLEDRDVLTWRNMSAEEAEVVHGAYETGVQHVSEILRSQGLW